MIGYAAIGVLELVALTRYRDDVEWSDAQAYVFLLFVVSMSLIGIHGWRAAHRHAGSPLA